MKGIFIITLACFGLITSCKNKNKEVTAETRAVTMADFLTFDIEKGVERIGKDTVSLNEIADEISFLKLDASILLQPHNLHFFEFGEGYVLSSGAFSSSTPIMMFDKSGSFNKILIRRGRGPIELIDYLTWTVNNNTKELVAGDDGEIVIYSSKYDAGKKTRIAGYGGGIIPLNDENYVMRGDPFGSPLEDAPFLTFVNRYGETIKEFRGRNNFINLPQGQGSWPLESYRIFHSSSGNAIFKDMFNDTLFLVSSVDEFRPYLHLKRGEKIPRKEDSFNDEKKRDQIFFEHLLESYRYLILTYTFDQKVHCAVMDKIDGKIISNFAGDPKRTIRTNGFMRYKTPKGEYLTVDIVSVSHNKMYCELSPTDAMKFVDGIAEDSNPVILIAKLK